MPTSYLEDIHLLASFKELRYSFSFLQYFFMVKAISLSTEMGRDTTNSIKSVDF